MNNVLLQQSGGFPLETDTLDFMQSAYKSLQALAAIAGDNYILKGCLKNGINVSNGVVVIDGEVLEFRGGIEIATIVIVEEKTPRPFENGQENDVFLSRYATFGNGVNEIAWDSIKRIKSLNFFKDLPGATSNAFNEDDENKLATAKAVKLLNDKVNALLPAGCILIWSGSITNVPVGWQLYEPLRDKFVLGAGLNYPVGAVGGEKEHVLTIAEMPEHDHDYLDANQPRPGSGTATNAYDDTNSKIWKKTSKSGGGQAHNNMPPYYALAYIIKL